MRGAFGAAITMRLRKLHNGISQGVTVHRRNRHGQVQPVTRQSPDLMWKLQRADGSWHWLKTTEPPSATYDHYGVTMV
jgi:hypothetical protein